MRKLLRYRRKSAASSWLPKGSGSGGNLVRVGGGSVAGGLARASGYPKIQKLSNHIPFESVWSIDKPLLKCRDNFMTALGCLFGLIAS